MNPAEEYVHASQLQSKQNINDRELQAAAEVFTEHLIRSNYVKSFTWMGVPIMQYPGDLVIMQELLWLTKPDYIIETGVAFGGGLVFYATILEAIGKRGQVLGIDIDPREHNMRILESHPLRRRISVVKGSSIDKNIIEAAKNFCSDGKVMVVLDSCHSCAHVLEELRLYAPLVSVGSYCVVMDTAIEFHGHLDKNQDRPWGKNNNPWTATQEFLKTEMGQNFVVDKEIEQRALITGAPDGWLKRIKETE